MLIDLKTIPAINTDFAVRAEDLRQSISAASSDNPDTPWTEVPSAGESHCHMYEAVEQPLAESAQAGMRITCLLTLGPQASLRVQPSSVGCEALVISGDLAVTNNPDKNYKAGHYLRLPQSTDLTFTSNNGCYALVKLGEMSLQDDRERLIDINTEDTWLPGPVEHTEVMPLHVHGERNALMIRWLAPTWFKPQLDPQGEEIFVLEGKLHDAYGSYLPGSWLRNPVPAWQAWGGHPGTLVYYKNGHFPG